MSKWIICALVLSYYSLQIQSLVTHPDAFLSIGEVANKYGYPLEHHYITTSDNYILLMHRIPHGKHKESKPTNRIPVLFINGLGGSSDNYLVAGPNRAIGYFLADNGYDVWLGNARGNKHSRNHTNLNPDINKEFWDFSWHEIGVIDIPEKIDYILNVTQQKKLYTFGLSQGNTCVVVTLAARPEYNEKVIANVMFGPSVFGSRMPNPLVQTVSRFYRFFEELSDFLDLREIIPNTQALNKVVYGLCTQSEVMIEICTQLLFITGGYGNGHNLDRGFLPKIFAQLPAGISVKQGLHYCQIIVSGKFRQYDYGKTKNMNKYQKITPPDYNLTNIKTGMAIFYGYNDWLVSVRDVKKFMRYLPNIVMDHPIPHYNHYDFVSSNDIMEAVNKPILKMMQKLDKDHLAMKTNI